MGWEDLLGKFIHTSGQHKDLFCKECQKVTDHVSISHAENLGRKSEKNLKNQIEKYKENQLKEIVTKLRYSTIDKPVSRIGGKIFDILPPVNIFYRPYMCMTCKNMRGD